MPRVTVSIVTYNGVGKLEDCLRALHAQTFNDYAVLVVDNASSDGTIAVVTNLTPEARIIALHENVGFGAGHNIAIRESTSEFILVLNQDVVLSPDALHRLVSAADASRAACVGPLLLRPRTDSAERTVDTAGQVKRPWWAVFDRGSGQPINASLQRSGYIWGISGACMLLRRTALQQIAYIRPDGAADYFDESFFMYKEDIDLCVRLRRVGQRCWYEAQALGDHGRTGKSGNRRALPAYVREHSYRNHWFLVLKHAWLVSFVLILPYELIKLLFILLHEPKTLRVIPDIVRHLPSLLKRRYA